MKPYTCSTRLVFIALISILLLSYTTPLSLQAQVSLRKKIGQMVMVTFTGDSLKKSSPSLDTLKTDLVEGNIGGVIFFTWSNNLRNPGQIALLTKELQQRSAIPLLIATDQEGGNVARLSKSNGFSSSPTAYKLGTQINREDSTRFYARLMAGWLAQCAININLAPVVDVNVNPKSIIGSSERSFSNDPMTVFNHANWFIDEFHKKKILTTLKHFPGHGSSTADSHEGFTDISTTWSENELIPYRQLLNAKIIDAIMTAHVFNKHIDTLYPATLSRATITGILRQQLGYQGVVVSDEMSMKAIADNFGLDEAIVLAINAGVDILLYNKNLNADSTSLARHVVDLVEQKIKQGIIVESRIEESYQRILLLKQRAITTPVLAGEGIPQQFRLGSFPNPFNATTTIVLSIPEHTNLTVRIFDLLGREVALLYNGEMVAGSHTLRWDAGRVSSGVYIVQFKAGSVFLSSKLVLMK
ncbi:MAG: glycoside hydrolase family 3 N-terminal domain-containing protein [bacterium]